MDANIKSFLEKFSNDAENLLRSVAAFNQLAHIQKHSYQDPFNNCRPKCPEQKIEEIMPVRNVSKTNSRKLSNIPSLKGVDSCKGTQTCKCLFKEGKGTSTERNSFSRKYSGSNSSAINKRDNCASLLNQQRATSAQSKRYSNSENIPSKPHTSCIKKRKTCWDNSDSDDPMEILEDWSYRFSEAEQTLRSLQTKIQDLSHQMNASKNKVPKVSPLCPPCMSDNDGGYNQPRRDSGHRDFSPLPPVPVTAPPLYSKKPRTFSFSNMPAITPHTVSTLPKSMVSGGCCSDKPSG